MTIQDPFWLCGEGFTCETAVDFLLFQWRSLTVMPARVLNLPKIKMNLKRNFKLLKANLLFRQLFSLKWNLTFPGSVLH